MLAPVSVRKPLPCLMKPPVPEITLASVVLLASPAVNVPLPSAMTPPVPDSAPTVWLLPLRLNAPPLTASAPVAASEPPGASCSVPAVTVVPPL